MSTDDQIQENDVQSICRRYLSEEDYRVIWQVRDRDTFLKQIRQGAWTFTLDQQLTHILDALQKFVNLTVAGSHYEEAQTSIIWSILLLLVQAAQQTETLLNPTLDILKDLRHNLEVFQIHGSFVSGRAQVGDELVGVFIEVVDFGAHLAHFLRRNKHGMPASKNWPNVMKKYEELSEKIRKQSDHFQEQRTALGPTQIQQPPIDLISQLSILGGQTVAGANLPAPVVDDGLFPCNNIPYPRNEHFFGRKDELAAIRQHLDFDPANPRFRSFALYGSGGIGKTQLALAYAHEQVQARVQAVIWVNCETGLSIARSFAAISEMLELEGRIADENSDQNRTLVMKWIRKTALSWFMVMDNVENVDLIRPCWPVSSHGSILITSRNDIVSIDPAASGIEVKIFSEEEGSRLLLDLVGRATYSSEELESARQLSEQVNGLALALITLASQVKIRRRSFRDFLDFYEKHRRAVHKERRGFETFYNKSLDTCWQTAFDFLSSDASSILAVLSFIAPDAIPEQLFRPEDPKKLPEPLTFCEDAWAFEEALNELLSSSLIRRDHVTKHLSVHRLIQQEFRERMTPSKSHECFTSTAALLSEGFPKHKNGLSLRNEWDRCKLYIQHVLILCRRWQDNKFRPKEKGEFQEFTNLMASCGWYLMECGASKECVELMDTALDVCEEKDSLDYSHLCNHLGCNEYERAHPELARPYLTKSLEIREKLLPPDHPELANSYNNYGNLVLQEFQEGAPQEAVRLFEKAIAIDKLQPEAESSKIMHIRHLNLGKSYWLLGKFPEALRNITAARDFAIRTFGPNCHFEGTANFLFGNVYFDQGRYAEAREAWKLAFRVFSLENEIHPSTTATQMKLASVDMKTGDVESAIKILQKTIVICQLNEQTKGDQGDSARMRWWLGEALAQCGKVKEAAAQKLIAQRIRKDFQGDRFERLPDGARSYDLMVFVDFW